MRLSSLVLVALGLIAPVAAGAQTHLEPLDPAVLPKALVRQGDEAHTALRPRDALALYKDALTAAPEDYDALWRAAREAVNLGMLASDGEKRKALYQEAVEYARRAQEANPLGPRGGEWLSIALGRQALDEGPRTRVRLAAEIRKIALETLALDSLNAGAHHVLGEWNAEIRRLSGVERWLARKFLGGDVMGEASWEQAEYHLRRAVELDPGGLVHHLDLARVYLDTGRKEEARAELRQVLERPAVEPVDPLYKQEAQELLQNG